MAKIKLAAEPTFDAKVLIPVPGGEAAPVLFTFIWRQKKDVVKWMEESKDGEDVDVIKACASGWELDDKFTDANIEKLCQNYAGAGFAIVETYLRELSGARTKN